MREFLEDAEKHNAKDPVKAAQAGGRPVLPKRFYKSVTVESADDGFAVLLDGKRVKTPGKQQFSLSTEKQAHLLAAEWDAQKEHINPLHMPVTRIVNTAIDGVEEQSQAVFEDILRYAGSDLLYYRAETPESLVEAQTRHWDPVLDWAQGELGAVFETGEGIAFITQPKEAIAAFGATLKRHDTALELACLHTFTSLTGSALLSLAIAEGFLDAETAWSAAHVDEDWNIGRWGEDHEAAQRRAQRWLEMSAAETLLSAVKEDNGS